MPPEPLARGGDHAVREGERERMARRSAMWAWRRRGYSVAWIAERFGVTAGEVTHELALERRAQERDWQSQHMHVM